MIIRSLDGQQLCNTDVETSLDVRDLRRADFRGQSIEGLDLSDTDLRDANFRGADLYWTYLYRANCEGVDFSTARLAGVVLEYANLRQCNFRDAYVSLDNLAGGCSLEGADLTGALLEGADFTGSTYDGTTLFPEGFDPTQNGLVRVMAEKIAAN